MGNDWDGYEYCDSGCGKLPTRRVVPHYGKEASIAADELSTWSAQFNVTFVAGDYWIVWPVVFDLMRRSGNQRAFGFTHRGNAVIEAVKGPSLSRIT